MNDLFWLVLAIPLTWPFIAKVLFHTRVNWQETAIALILASSLAWAVWESGRAERAAAVEILNGQVSAKYQERVPCSHSYECFCTESTVDGVTTRICQTCYEHAGDYDWVVESDAGSITIDRIDRQGSETPPRFDAVRIGEPFAIEHGYQNWIKAAQSSLFHADPLLAARYEGSLPDYPGRVYDYYRIDRLVADGVAIEDAALWNRDISEALIALGPRKEVNLVIVVTADPSPDYAAALWARWQGANKNDVVVVMGAPDYPALGWARVFSWTRDETVNIALRNDLEALGRVERESVMPIVVRNIDAHFVRRPMAEFAYLEDEVEPTFWAFVMALMTAIPGSLALTWFFHRHEIDFLNRGRESPFRIARRWR